MGGNRFAIKVDGVCRERHRRVQGGVYESTPMLDLIVNGAPFEWAYQVEFLRDARERMGAPLAVAMCAMRSGLAELL